MQFSRRGFLKLGAGATASVAFGGLGISLTPVAAAAQDAKLKWTRQTTSVCCYCAVGCGLLVSTSAEGHPDGPGKAINVEGNPDHPINEGSLCAKGFVIFILLFTELHHPGRHENFEMRFKEAERLQRGPRSRGIGVVRVVD